MLIESGIYGDFYQFGAGVFLRAFNGPFVGPFVSLTDAQWHLFRRFCFEH